MQFHDYRTVAQQARKNPAVADALRASQRALAAHPIRRQSLTEVLEDTAVLDVYEQQWAQERRPYYSIYPAVTQSLLRMNLEHTISADIVLPRDALLVRLPVGRELVVEGYTIRSFLVIKRVVAGSGQLTSFIKIVAPGCEGPELTAVSVFKLNGRTAEELISTNVNQRQPGCVPFVVISTCMRMLCTICLLGDNPDIIKPDVLDADRQAYKETGAQKYVDKAQRRGKVGWVVGADMEVTAHIRLPHFALRWTGTGRLIPKIVPVKGSLIHGKKFTSVPQGYLDDQPTPPGEPDAAEPTLSAVQG